MNVKKPWERRLKDLSHILSSCSSTYFDLELFRLNVNQFLQTARTVTFIIQKNKAEIPDFENWYNENVLASWKQDELMKWAKDSRNKIEKQGDLEMYSSLKTTLLFSYIEEQDIEIEYPDEKYIRYGIKKLVRLAQKALPSGTSDAAVVKVERTWITKSLPEWELLHALNYVYSRMYECCDSLGIHLGSRINNEIPTGLDAHKSRDAARKSIYVKLNGLKNHQQQYKTIEIGESFSPPEEIKALFKNEKPQERCIDLKSSADFYARVAETIFTRDEYHIPTLLLFNKNWQVADIVSSLLDDQADKYIFWRSIAEKVASQKIEGLIWISELWLRSIKNHEHKAIRNMPITGEQLYLVGINNNCDQTTHKWNIIRDIENKPKLEKITESESKFDDRSPLFFLVPVMRAMGIDDNKIIKK